MKIIYNYTYHDNKHFLIILIYCVLMFVSTAEVCTAQTSKNDSIKDIELSFVKSNDSIKSTDLYFNVLKIKNNSSKVISGNISFQCPENWKLIAFPVNDITLNAGDSSFIPVHLSPASNALGGIAYILSGTLRTNERMVTSNSYIALPTKTSWDFTTNNNVIYFNENNPNSLFQIKLSNKGNTNELIKLVYKMGRLLMFTNSSMDEYTEFIDLPAFKDTVINQYITYKKNLSYAEKLRYERNWKESSINIIASTERIEKVATIMIRKLNSSYFNQRAENASPLNFDYQTYNLMSNQAPRSTVKVYGNLLFPKKREVQYMFGAQNLYYDKALYKDFNPNNQLVYSLRYSDKRNRIEFGYNINGGNLHAINGRGINGSFSLNSQNKIHYTLSQNPYTQNLGAYIGTNFNISRFAINADATHEQHISGSYNATSVSLGAGFSLFKHHTFSIQGLVSQVKYTMSPGRDTAVLGFSYKADYSINYEKFNLHLSALNSASNYIQNAGQQQIYLDSKYTVNGKVRISLYGNRQLYATSHFPYNFFAPATYNSTDYIRLTTSISNGNVTYQIGPSYSGSMRQNYNPLTHYTSDYLTHQPGLWGSASVRINNYGSISPNFSISNMRLYFNTKDPSLESYSMVNNIYYSVGLNYFDNVWRANISYINGSSSDIYRSMQLDSDPVTSKSIQFRPSYENYFFERKLKLSAFINYAYYMPSGRENVTYNVKSDLFLKKGWTAYVSGFIYSNTRVNDEQGRITTKDLNFIVGIAKSFNIQQPRLKYYNLKSVFFNDLDGNGLKTDNEPPVSNIMVNIAKDQSVKPGMSTIPEMVLLSDVNGEIKYENLPKDFYRLKLQPLVNLQNLYFIDGSDQPYYNDKDRVLYVPLAESYRVKGKIILVRDQNSLEGKIDLRGIRVTATGDKGETFSALTDNFGSYLLTVSTANKYKIHVNNVFGEQFSIDTDEMEVQFAQNKAINLDFTFFEKRRDVEFENGNEIFKFKSISGQSESPDNPVKPQKLVVESNNSTAIPLSYAIQLGVSKIYRDPSFYLKANKLSGDVFYLEKNGEYKYFTGTFSTLAAAKKAISKISTKGLLAVAVDRSLLKKAETSFTPISTTYSVQLDVLKTFREPSFYKDKFKLIDEVLFLEKNGEFKYYVGNYKTIEDAKVDITKFGMSGFPVAVDRALLKKSVKAEKDKEYAIQLDVLKSYREPSFYKDKFKLTDDVLFIEKDGEFKYYFGTYTSIESAKADITKLALTGFPVSIDRSTLKKTLLADSTTNYSIQLDALKSYREPSFYNDKFKLNEEVLFVEKDGEFKYYFGSYKTSEAAKDDITKLQLTGFPVVIDKSLLKKAMVIEANFSIQLDALKTFRDPSFYKKKFKLTDDVMFMEIDNEFKYYYGSYSSVENAKVDINRFKLSGFAIAIDKALLKKAVVAEIKNTTFSIQLDVLNIYRDPSYYKEKFKLLEDVFVFEDKGKFKYFTGKYKTKDEAKAGKTKLGLEGVPVEVDIKLLKKASDIEESHKINPAIKMLTESALYSVQFEANKDEIKKSSYTLLNKIANLMKENPTYNIEINVHTDNQGDVTKSLELSQMQSDSVKKYLIDKGVEIARLTSKGLGSTIPIAENTTKEGRLKNSRLELKFRY